MARQAVLVGRAGQVAHLADLVRRVAVHAGRDLVRLFFPEFAFDDLAVDLFDLTVATRAGRGDVVPVNARSPVAMRQDVVRGVARGADRRDGQALSEQAFAVDRHRVVLEDAVLVNLAVEAYGRALLVAAAAQ